MAPNEPAAFDAANYSTRRPETSLLVNFCAYPGLQYECRVNKKKRFDGIDAPQTTLDTQKGTGVNEP